jgi:membrane fusion protein (multidrug efflux system)
MTSTDSLGTSDSTQPSPNGYESAPSGRSRMQRARVPVMIGVVLIAILIGLLVYLGGGRYQTTDDAEVKGSRVWISSSISGRVVARNVREGQIVHAGDVLFQLDERPAQTAVDEARANVAAVRAQIDGLQATYRQRLDDQKAAEDSLAYLQGEANRQKALVAAGTATGAQEAAAASQVDQAVQKVAAAREQTANALAALGGDASRPLDQHPLVLQARAQLERASLDRSYVDVVAPQDGVVTKVDQLEVGDYVTAATPVFALVSTRLWVEANFKENQLEYMRPGQRVSLKIDAYPDRRFEGRVRAVSPGTGSSFSTLPAENATGNWVKVTQRVPVTIDFAGDIDVPMSAGLSVSAKVDTQHHRSLFGASPRPAARP